MLEGSIVLEMLKEWGYGDLPIYLGAEIPIIHWKFSEDMADESDG